MVKLFSLPRSALFGVLFAFGVIALGAFTRLIDAGLGCPDWPGCYGHLTVSAAEQAGTALVAYKAWAEMIHRYFVAGLSFFITFIALRIFCQKIWRTRVNVLLAIFLLALLVYQILLGQLTVTWKLLPIVVSQHLLGGFFILSTLWAIYLFNRPQPKIMPNKDAGKLYIGSMIGLVLLLIQISLGAWTSTNYASLSCPDFPFCSYAHDFVWHWRAAFYLFSPIGINYDGGVLPDVIRQTIQMAHRLGALILTCYLVIFMMIAMPRLKKSYTIMGSLYAVLGLLSVQICLGISNIIFKLPLFVALCHTLVAALLLLDMISLTYKLAQAKRGVV